MEETKEADDQSDDSFQDHNDLGAPLLFDDYWILLRRTGYKVFSPLDILPRISPKYVAYP